MAVYATVLFIGAVLSWARITQVIAANGLIQASREPADIVLFYAAGSLLHQPGAQALHVYDERVFTDAIAKVTSPFVSPGVYRFFYPPYWLPILGAYAAMPFHTAWIAWTITGILCVIGGIWMSDQDGIKRRVVVTIGAAASLPAFYNFKEGQTTMFVFLGLALFFCLCRRKNYFLAGLSTVVLLMKIQFAPLAIIAGCLLGKGRFVAGLAAAGVFLLCLTLFGAGAGNISQYVQTLLSADLNHHYVVPESMENVRAAAIVLGMSQHAAMILALVVFALACLGGCWLWWRIYPRLRDACGETAFDACSALTILGALMFSLHIMSYDYLSLALAALFTWRFLGEIKTRPALDRSLRGLILALPVLSWGSMTVPLLVKGASSLGIAGLIALLPAIVLLTRPHLALGMVWSVLLLDVIFRAVQPAPGAVLEPKTNT